MNKNINSQEVENFTPIFKKEVREKWYKVFNEEQKELYDKLEIFLASDEEMFMLEGYAGTGKTFLMTRVVESLGEDYKVVLTAPTNKAVKVLKDFSSGKVKTPTKTIHKLLSLTIRRKPPKVKGGKPTVILVKNPYGKSDVCAYKLIIVDEASMLDDKLFKMLKSEKLKKTKVIFMGDPAQIPPVNQGDCIPLTKDGRKEYNIQHGTLSKIMRQANGSRIIEISYQIRNNRWTQLNPILDRTDGGDVTFYNSHHGGQRNKFVSTFLHLFQTPEFNLDSNYCKVIAYKNVSVDKVNTLVRKTLYKSQLIKRIMVGEKLIANSPIMKNGDIQFNTSEEFTVIEMEDAFEYYDIPEGEDETPNLQESFKLGYFEDDSNTQHEFRFQYYRCKVEYTIDDEAHYAYIDILSEHSTKAFNYVLNKLKRKGLWKGSRGFFSLSDRFANVKYNYAITAHKAQGSTYKNVFILEDDIDTNRKILERNRIKYTAVSRASEHLHILTIRSKVVTEILNQQDLF